MTYFKDLELEICKLDFDGVPLLEIADRVGLSVPQVSAILDQIDDDVYTYADIAADLDAEYYGSV
jgi:DNA-binding Lrp family transcriptional regulator